MTPNTTASITKDSIFERLQEAVRGFFNCPDEDVFLDTVAFDIDGWDSLAHATFMLDLEDRFSIQFTGTEVLEFENISSIVNSVYGHLLEGAVPHKAGVPQIVKPTNTIDSQYRTLIFDFNNVQMIQTVAGVGFWDELDKLGFTDGDAQSSKIDLQDNFIDLPIRCNPKDSIGCEIRLESVAGDPISGLAIEINGIPSPLKPLKDPNTYLLVFRARDHLSTNALEGKNDFRFRFDCSGDLKINARLFFITFKRNRWTDGISGSNGKTAYSGESLWGDLWRLNSREFLMKMNDSYHGGPGSCSPNTEWHVIGDSHAIFNFAVYPECKTHYVNGFSVFYLIKNQFDITKFNIPDGSKVIFVFGEIDCRTIIGSMAARISPQEFSHYLAEEYAKMIHKICSSRNFDVAITLPAPPYPKNTSTDPDIPVVGSIKERAEYTRIFCDALRILKGNGCITEVIDAYTPFANKDGLLDRFFATDEAHLRPDRTDPLFAQARSWAKNNSQLTSDDKRIHAQSSFKQGDFVGAEKSYLELLQDFPEDSGLHEALGLVLKMQGQVDQAKLSFLNAFELDPFNVTALTNLIPRAEKGSPESRRLQRDEIAGVVEWANTRGPESFFEVVFALLSQQVLDGLDQNRDAELEDIWTLAASLAAGAPEMERELRSLHSFYLESGSDLKEANFATLLETAGKNGEADYSYFAARLKPVETVPTLEIKEHQQSRPYASSAVYTQGINQVKFPGQVQAKSLFMASSQKAAVTENFMVISEDGELIEDHFTHFRIEPDSKNPITSIYTEIQQIRTDSILLKMRGRPRRISEPCILISGGPESARNYYHWMVDYLPRMLLAENDKNLDGLKFIVNADLSSFQIKSLEMLGVDKSRLILKEAQEWLLCDRLYIPSFVSKTGNPHPEAINFLRRHFLPHVRGREEKAPSRVYLSRSDSTSRVIQNEAEVENVLREHQFEIIVPGKIPLDQQIWSVSNAKIVVVPHGAALTNLAFVPPEAQVLEILTKTHLSGLCICSGLGLPYRHLAAIPVEGNTDNPVVSIDELRTALSKMLLADDVSR